jgi:ATP-dependent HslUV protease, peptidase subunit HslV
MSTIVVARKEGIAAIGADTMSCYGETRETAQYVANASKITRIGENYLATVGHVSWGLVLESYFASLDRPPLLDSPRAVFEMARRLHVTLKDEYFLNPNEDEEYPFESSQVACLVANPHGIFGLYSLRSVAAYSRFYAFGSGYKFALGAMHAAYDAPGATAEQVARAGAEAGAEFDRGSGRPVEVFTVPLLGSG